MANVVSAPAALTATVVAVSTDTRMRETAGALQRLRDRAAVRTIAISLGDNRQPTVNREGNATAIERIVPQYLNNAVAALRLSSLPSIAWWRGDDTAVLPDLARLVDRLVLDAEDPRPSWALCRTLSELTIVSDLRWAALTRWRNLIAQFFDVPELRQDIARFSRVTIEASDRHAAALLAGWLKSRLKAPTFDVQISPAEGPRMVNRVVLEGKPHCLVLEMLPRSSCIRTAIQCGEEETAARTVAAANESPEALITGELRVRARDLAFEQALDASKEQS